MRIEYQLPFRRSPVRPCIQVEPEAEASPAPRIARLIALAHKLDALVRLGAVTDYSALARLGHITPARLTQIMVLLHLSPAIQEHVLFLPDTDGRFISELKLRTIAREPIWEWQRIKFERLLRADASDQRSASVAPSRQAC